MGMGRAAPALPTKPKIVPNAKMLGLFWTVIPVNKIGATVWKDLSDEKVDMSMEKIESRFCKKKSKRKSTGKTGAGAAANAGAAAASKKSKGGISLLDGKRQQNGGIAVAKLKISHEELKEVVYSLDSDVLEPEKIPLLLGCVPTSEELGMLNACAYPTCFSIRADIGKQLTHLTADLCILTLTDKSSGKALEDLAKVDRFLLSISEIKHFKQKIECVQVKNRYEDEMEALWDRIKVMEKAVKQLRTSKTWENVLQVGVLLCEEEAGQTCSMWLSSWNLPTSPTTLPAPQKVMLKIGNYLNGSTRRGGAYGFKIDVLKKVNIVKAIDKKSTLVDFIAETLQEQKKGDFHDPLALSGELPSLRGAASYSLSEVEKDFKWLAKNVASVKAEVEWAADNAPEEDKFEDKMDTFVTTAEMDMDEMKEKLDALKVDAEEIVQSYGESPKRMGLDELCMLIADFSDLFAKCAAKLEDADGDKGKGKIR